MRVTRTGVCWSSGIPRLGCHLCFLAIESIRQDFVPIPAKISFAITAPSEFGAILISVSSFYLASGMRFCLMSKRAASL